MLEKFRGQTIAVLMGGLSREREISLKSGAAILASLLRQGYEAITVEVDERVAERLIELKPSATIVALHGRLGEDGIMQGLLETMRIPYSGSGVLASAICMDKALTKDLVSQWGVSVPQSSAVSAVDSVMTSYREQHLSCPLVVKPNREGSTLGIRIVKRDDDIKAAVTEALQYDSVVLLEEFVEGTEVTVGLLNGKALPVLEIVPTSGFYDYEAKYTKGLTEYIVPARISETVAKNIQGQSELIAARLNLQGVTRADFIIDSKNRAYFLEVNTIPGMTETSLVPKAAEQAGITFDQIVTTMLESVSLET